MSANNWNPELYQESHSFVWRKAADLIDLLAPSAGERVLDAGCGTGQLTAAIAARGVEVVGVDSSPEMVERARANYPELNFRVADLRRLEFHSEFDAVFSNAVLHWVRDASDAARSIASALKPGGRFVAEFGGKGNIQQVMDALAKAGVTEHPWYYPGIAEYSSVLEGVGLEVTLATLFDRMTQLDTPLTDWLRMFTRGFAPDLNLEEVQHHAAELFFDGKWHVDYRRLRVVARK